MRDNHSCIVIYPELRWEFSLPDAFFHHNQIYTQYAISQCTKVHFSFPSASGLLSVAIFINYLKKSNSRSVSCIYQHEREIKILVITDRYWCPGDPWCQNSQTLRFWLVR
jgi:hypothetical protein